MTSNRVSGFLPSTSGLHYANDFPNEPVFQIPMGASRIPVGNAADGLCGGMVFAVRDLFQAGRPPPPDTTPPARETPAFGFLVRRLLESWNLPQGPARYLLWMTLPDGDGWLGRGVWWRTTRVEWPLVKADIDRGEPSPLGLVRVRSWNPWDLALNHQALAYAYDLDVERRRLDLSVYDPNHPNEDDVRLRVDLDLPESPPSYVTGERPVRGFFRTLYRPRDPAPLGAQEG